MSSYYYSELSIPNKNCCKHCNSSLTSNKQFPPRWYTAYITTALLAWGRCYSLA